MNTVFADSVYYFALLSARDQYAVSAQEFTKVFLGHFVTTSAVLTEIGNGLSRTAQRGSFTALVRALLKHHKVTVIWETADLWNRALDLYASRPDKHWSLTDCMSFVVMREHGISDALTADRHFEQAGFQVLLK